MNRPILSTTTESTTTATEKSSAATAADACPRCGQKLIDPAGMGWCSKCGFCRSLEDDRAKVPLQKPDTHPTKPRGDMGNFLLLFGMIPRWAWVLLGGMVLMVAATLGPSWQLPKNSFDRAIYCTLQIVIGLLLILAAQFYALIRLAPMDEKLGFKDIFLPLRLWSLVFQGLPRLRGAMWTAGWGLTLILAALFLVGGLSYWMRYLPGQQKAGPGAKVPAKTAR